MNLIPNLELTILSGGLLFAIYLIVFATTMLSFPKEIRKRFYDRSGWTKKQKIYTLISKIFALLNIILIVFSAFTTETYLLVIGTIIFVLGLAGLIISFNQFSKPPYDKPCETGLYKYSRNPQMITIWMIFLGIGILTNSILSIILLVLNIVFANQYIKAEEETCTRQYGKEFEEYLARVRRYFWNKMSHIVQKNSINKNNTLRENIWEN